MSDIKTATIMQLKAELKQREMQQYKNSICEFRAAITISGKNYDDKFILPEEYWKLITEAFKTYDSIITT